MTIVDKIYDKQPELSICDQKIAHVILKNPIEVVDKTISELAEEAGVSLASISRFCKTLGLAGFHQLKIELARVSEENTTQAVEKENFGGQLSEFVKDKEIELEKTFSQISQETCEKICGKLLHARAIQVIAEGNTYANAEDAVYKFSQIGLFAFSSASWETALAQTMNLQKEDVLLVFSNSGEAKSLLVQIDEAKKRGITVISLTNHENSPIAQKSDLHWRTVARPKVLMSEYYYSRLALVSAIEAMFILILKKEPKRLERIKFHELLMADKKI